MLSYVRLGDRLCRLPIVVRGTLLYYPLELIRKMGLSRADPGPRLKQLVERYVVYEHVDS